MFIHSGFFIIVLGFLGFFLSNSFHRYISLPITLLLLVSALFVGNQTGLSINLLSYDLTLLRIDGLSRVFLIVFLLMTFCGLIFSINQRNKKEISWALIYAGSGVSAVLAGDLLSFFVFCEVMAIASTFLILGTRTELSRTAGFRYAIIHFFAGVLILVGIAGVINTTGNVAFDQLEFSDIYTKFIFVGFLINAGCYPFSSWIPDSYPEASYSGSVFLSAFTTKTAVYSILRGFPGTELLIYLGLIMIFYGIIYALLENDMRRILSYSIVNQVGFMLVGAGIGTEMAINGASSHAFAHILYKALLLMSAGSVLYMTGRRNCTELGGLFQSMPITMICGVIGAFAISAFPFTSGFVTKSMISYAAADEHLFYVWLGLVAASAGVFLHAGIKFPWFVFFQKDSGLRPPDPPSNMRLSMYILSAFCILLGLFPSAIYSILPYEVDYEPYTVSHILFQLQLLLFAGFAFFVMLPLLKRTQTISLDFDWIARKPLRKAFLTVERFVEKAQCQIKESVTALLRRRFAKKIFDAKKIVKVTMGMPTNVMVLSLQIVLITFLLILVIS
ncbi:MAG: Na(+)/H(+) antiporter subunit D [Verrucomicrobiales bacterium]|nr:Na(+)/H(+) antiporter subunit D [Verrucomicrobiales bacterium]